MNRLVRLVVVASISVAMTHAAASPVERFRFRRSIDAAGAAAEELVAVRLDAAVAAESTDGFPDVRVVDGDGREVSRILRRASTVKMRTVRRSFPVERRRLKPLPGGGLEIEFTVDPEKYPLPIDGFRFETPLRDFEQRVRVERLDDAGHWSPVGDETLLYDYSRYMDSRQLDVALPGGPHGAGGSWRITVDEPTIEQQSTLAEVVRTLEGGTETGRQERTTLVRQPFRIDSILAWHADDVAEIRVADGIETPLDGFRVEEEVKEKRTRIRVSSGREPVTALRLAVAERNFGRQARVERPASATRFAGDGDRPPPVLGRARLHSIELRGIRSEELGIPIPESRLRDYEIVIENADSPPLTITGVTAVGPAYEVVFLARPGGVYKLAYGVDPSDDAPLPAPQYDTVAIDAALAAGKVPLEGTLGDVEAVAVVPGGRPWIARALGNPWLIGGVILLLAVLLGVSLVSAAKRIDTGE